LQPDHRPAILHTRTLKTAQAVWIWIPRHDPAQYAGEPDNAAATQGQERRSGANGDSLKQKTLLLAPALPALETEIQFEICIFILDGKAISKYRPVATISKVEIAAHFPVVLVGECLPQTLLLL